MRKITGSCVVNRPAGHEEGLGATAQVNLYGPKGGYIGATYIDQREAKQVIARLQSFIDRTKG